MGVQEHDLGCIKLLGIEFIQDAVGYFGGNHSVGVANGQIHCPENRKSALRIGQNGHADIGNTLLNPVIDLWSFDQRAARIIIYLYSAVGSFLNFLTP